MLTAYSSVVHMPPGIYQLADVLKGKTKYYRSGRPRSPYRHTRWLSPKEVASKMRRMALMMIDSLPDDERELWNR